VNWRASPCQKWIFGAAIAPAHLSRSLYILLRKRRLALATSVTSALTRGVPIDAAGRASRIFVNKGLRWGGSYAQYNFLCRACKKEFSEILTLSEHEKGKIVCPH